MSRVKTSIVPSHHDCSWNSLCRFWCLAIRALAFHERAGLALGCASSALVGGLASILLRRSFSAALSGLIALGGIALAPGLYFLKSRNPTTADLSSWS